MYLRDVELLFDDGVQTKAQSKAQVAWLHTDLPDDAHSIVEQSGQILLAHLDRLDLPLSEMCVINGCTQRGSAAPTTSSTRPLDSV